MIYTIITVDTHCRNRNIIQITCTARSTVLAAPPAMVKDKSGEGGQTAVGLDPIN